MSAIQFPETLDSSADLQVWNNAAYDRTGEISEDPTASRQSWGSLKSIFGNPQASFDSDDSGKENQCLVVDNNIQITPVAEPFKAINAFDKSRTEGVSEKGFAEIDEEIADVESQIARLKSRLEALRLEKSRMSKALERRGRVVPAKFMDPIPSSKDKKMAEEVSSMSTRPKLQRRGISLGPLEIVSGGGRRGVMSMGPAEIFGGVKSVKSTQQISRKQETITPIQSRRKSCFLKLKDIDEKKPALVKERGKSSSVSPRSRKAGFKNQFETSRQAVTTNALKKTFPIVHSVQPKKLFGEGEKSVPVAGNKPSLRSGRVVASRYNQNTAQPSAMRKRSLPENDNGSLSVGKSKTRAGNGNGNGNGNVGSESRAKKRWEIPREIFIHGKMEVEEEMPIVARCDVLPRIKVGHCVRDSPRDSGPAKKVVELIGRKSFFWNEDMEVEPSVCQSLTYAEEEEDEEFSFHC